MKKSIWLLGGGVLFLAFVFWPRTAPRPRSVPAAPARSAKTSISPTTPAAAPLLAVQAAQHGKLRTPPVTKARLDAAAPTPAPAPPAARPEAVFSDFNAWAREFLDDPAAGASRIAEGSRLAMARREALAQEIKLNPKRALQRAVPWRWRQELPREITASFEEVVVGRATYEVYCATPFPGAKTSDFKGHIRRYVIMKATGRTYAAFTYGQRASLMGHQNIAVHGIAVGDVLALHDAPARVLEPDEAAALQTAATAAATPACSFCGVVPSGSGRVLNYGGQFLTVCDLGHAAKLNATLGDAEARTRRVGLASAGGSPGGGNNVWTTPPPENGSYRILYMRAVFPDDTRVPIGESEARQVMHEANDFYVEASYNKVGLVSTITPVLMLPYPKLDYSFEGEGTLMADAVEAARQAGFVAGEYDILILRHPSVPGYPWGGLGGGGQVWLQSSDVGTTIHELGHVFGLGHANYWQTHRPALPGEPNSFDADSLVGHDSVIGVGDDVEYGDVFDVMGSGGGEGPVNTNQAVSAFRGHFNPIGKTILGWLPWPHVTEAVTGSTNRIYVHDTPRLVDGRQYALTIDKDAQRTYWVSARSKTANQWGTNGVELHWGPWQQALGYSHLLDTTPGTGHERQDAAIAVGRTFIDAESKVYITPAGRGGSGTNIWYDVVIYKGDQPGNVAPEMELTVSTNAVRPGGAVTFTVTATDANSDALAYYWDMSDGMVAPNSPTFTRVFAQQGDYVVRVEVSDMRGGLTSKHVVIRVGAPTTLLISGQVMSTDNVPLQRVRVSNGSLTEAHNLASDYQWTYTDSDGAFTLVNLTNNRSYPVGAYLEGYITKPLNFDTEVELGDRDAEGVLFLASPRTVVTVKRIQDGDAVAKKSGIFELTRTGDTNTALLASFLFGGDAEAGTDYTDWTNVVTESNTTPNPFGPVTTDYDFYAVEFPTGIVSTRIEIQPLPAMTNAHEKEVALTVMYPLQWDQLYLTNGEVEGTIVTNTNTFFYSGWQLINVNGVDTWFQNYSEYLPAWPGEARLKLKGTPQAMPKVSVFALAPAAMENQYDTAAFIVFRSGPTASSLKIPLIVGGTATPVSDYGMLPEYVTLPAGATYVLVSVSARQDLYLEGNETVTLTLDKGSGYELGTTTAEVTIVDNDLPMVTITATDGFAAERGPDPGTLAVTRQGDMTRDLVVNYLVTGTAVGGVDYRALPGTITIPAGQPSALITVTPRDNGFADGGNTLEVFLSQSPTYNIGSPGTASVFIYDRALPTVSVQATDAAAGEGGDAGEFVIRREGDLTRELIVKFKMSGTAKPFADYVSLGSQVRIPAGVDRATLTLTPVGDTFREDAEYVILQLVAGAEYNLGTDYQASVDLSDDDSGALPAVGFDFLTSSGAEAGAAALIAVTVSANPAEDNLVTVLYKVTGGSALPEVDYPVGTSTGLVTFAYLDPTAENPWTNRTALISIPFTDNEVPQADRTLVVTLLAPPSWVTNWLSTNEITFTNDLGEVATTNQVVTNYSIVGTPMNASFDVYDTHTFTIKDDDAAVLTLETVQAEAGEQDLKPGLFRIHRDGLTNRAQQVRLQVTGFAENGADFERIPSTVVIPEGEYFVDVPVAPVDDPAQEFMEDVVVTLIGGPGARLGDTIQGKIDIVDNDGTVEFAQADYATPENVGIFQVAVRRTGYTNDPVSVDFTVSAGTAGAGTDFVQTNGTLRFEAGEVLRYIDVTVVDDEIVEPDETVQVVLRNLTGGGPIGGQTFATLTLLNDDAAVQFTQPLYYVNEQATNAIIAVQRLGVIEKLITVDFYATNGTATAGVEFGETNRPVTMPPGVTNMNVLVRILDNELIESNKTVQLVLTTNVAGLGSVGPQSNAVLEIRNDDCALDFTASDYPADEFARVVLLTVRRVGGTVNPVSVDYATTNLTAKSGTDYISAKGTLVFAGDTNVLAQGGTGELIFQPGETNKQFQVRLVDNSTGEGNRTFEARLSNAKGPVRGVLPGATVLGAQTNAVVTIIDDELPGSVDFGFNPGLGADGPVYGVAVQPDGKIVLGGAFATVDGISLSRVARLHVDGYLDTFFNPGAGPDATVHAVAVQPDGRILLGGEFTHYNGFVATRVARVDTDGTLDPAFVPGAGPDRAVRALAIGANGLIVIGGDFLTVNGQSRPGLARLLPDGSVDDTFDPGAGAPGGVYAVAVQADGAVLAAGAFSGAGGANYSYLARFGSDGTVDRSFNSGAGPDAQVRSVAVASDGKIVIGGAFTKFNNVDRNGIARLNPDGSLDTGFDPGTGANAEVYAVGVQSDRKVIVAGDFTAVAGQALNRYSRLNPNGSVDDGFLIFQGANGLVRTLALQPDSAIVLGGDFTTLNGLNRKRIGRVHGDEKFIVSKIQFASGSYRVAEDAGPVLVTVVRSGDLASPASVDFATGTGTATAGVNYQPTNGTLSFLAGETEKTFQVEVMDDHAARGNLTVDLVLSNLPPGYSENAQLTAVLTIEDKESVLGFSAAAYSVLRTEPEASITVVRSGPTTNRVTVEYATADGTAVDGVDYTATQGTLTFDPGAATQSFIVAIMTNATSSETKTIKLALSNPGTGAVLGTVSNAVLSIVNEVVNFYSLNLTPPVGGTVVPGSGQYPAGSTQVLTASPDRDFRFVGWEGDTNTTSNPLTLVMDRNYNLTARFEPTAFTYTFEPPFLASELQSPPWINSTTAPWQLQSATAGAGQYALKSGAIGNGQESVIEMLVDTRAGAVSFLFRVSSEANWDFFEFYVNGVRLQRWSGNLPWQTYQANVGAGRNRFTWRYVKDANFNFGLDAAFIDNLYVPLNVPDPTPIAAVLGVAVVSDGVLGIQLNGRRGVTYVLQASEDFLGWTPIGTNTLQGTSTQFFDTLSSERSARYYRAVAP